MDKKTEDRLTSIELRLTALESRFPAAAPAPAAAPSRPGATVTTAAPPAASTTHTTPRPTLNASPLPQWPTAPSRHLSGGWLAVVAILCFVVAAGYMVKLSIDSGWLTPTRQLAAAVLLGLLLIGAGLRLLATDRAYASYLPGGGIIILYLCAFAAHRYYGVLGFETALAAVGMVAGSCIGLYRQIRHDIYLITASVGAYLAPFVLGLNAGGAFSLYYLFICSLAFAWLAQWLPSRLLAMVSAYLAILVTAWVGEQLEQQGLVAILLALHFLAFALATYTHSVRHKTALTEDEAMCFLPVLLIFYASEYYFISSLYPALAPWISLCFAAVLIGLYLMARPYFAENLASRTLVLAFATLVGFHSGYLELLPRAFGPWLFCLLVLGYVFVPQRSASLNFRSAAFFPLAGLGVVALLEYGRLLYHLLDGGEETGLLLPALLGLGCLWVAILRTLTPGKPEQQGAVLLFSAHLLAIAGFYRLTIDISSLLVSACWLCYAVAVMLLAFQRRDVYMAKSALMVLALAAVKALLFDTANTAAIIRIFCLLLTGGVLFGCGLMLRRLESWRLPSGLLGHKTE